jgi:hypothetical protein
MSRGSAFITAFAVCALAVSAVGWGSLVSSFDAPGGARYPSGIGYRDNYLYICTNEPDMCYRTTTTGSVVRSHASPTSVTRGSAAGVVGGNAYYWVVSYVPRVIYQVGYDSGSIYNSFLAPGSYPYGAAFRQSGSSYYLYYTDTSSQRLHYLNATNGSIFATYVLGFLAKDCGYDSSGYLWFTDSSSKVVRKCTLTGSVVDSFSVAAYGYPSGCAYDGTYVWVGINEPLHRILRFETSGSSAIEPSSFGKIKTVFR